MRKGVLIIMGFLLLSSLMFAQTMFDFESGLQGWANTTSKGAGFTNIQTIVDSTARGTGKVMDLTFNGSGNTGGQVQVQNVDYYKAPVIGFWVYLPSSIPDSYNIKVVGQDGWSWSDAANVYSVGAIPKDTWYPIYLNVKQLSLQQNNFVPDQAGLVKLQFRVDRSGATGADTAWQGDILVDDIQAFGTAPVLFSGGDFESGNPFNPGFFGKAIVNDSVIADTTARATGNVLAVHYDGTVDTQMVGGSIEKDPYMTISADLVSLWVYLPSDIPSGYLLIMDGQDNQSWSDAQDTIAVSSVPKDTWFPLTLYARQLSIKKSNFNPYGSHQLAKFLFKITPGTSTGNDTKWVGTVLVDDWAQWGVQVPPYWIVDNFSSIAGGTSGWYNNSGIHAAVDSLYRSNAVGPDGNGGVLAANFNFAKSDTGDISKDNFLVYNSTSGNYATGISVNVLIPNSMPDGYISLVVGPNNTWNEQDFKISDIGRGKWQKITFDMSKISQVQNVNITIQANLNTTASYDTTILFDDITIEGINPPETGVVSPQTVGYVKTYTPQDGKGYEWVELDWVDNVNPATYNIYRSKSPITDLNASGVQQVASAIPQGTQQWGFRPYTTDGKSITQYYAVTAVALNANNDTVESTLNSQCKTGAMVLDSTSVSYKVPYIKNFGDSFAPYMDTGDGTPFSADPYWIYPEDCKGSAARVSTWTPSSTVFNYKMKIVEDDTAMYIHAEVEDVDPTLASFGTIYCWNGDGIEFYISFYDKDTLKIWHNDKAALNRNALGDIRCGINDLGQVNVGETPNGGMIGGYSPSLSGTGWSVNMKIGLDSVANAYAARHNNMMMPFRIDANNINPDPPYNETSKAQVLHTGEVNAMGFESDWLRPQTYGSLELINFKVTGMKNTVSNLPKTYKLYNNYPNPFNPSTTIKYDLPKESQVQLKIYDIVGREVATLVNGKQKAGNYSVNFNASKLASGVYIYRIIAGNFVRSHKMILLK